MVRNVRCVMVMVMLMVVMVMAAIIVNARCPGALVSLAATPISGMQLLAYPPRGLLCNRSFLRFLECSCETLLVDVIYV